MAFYTYPPRIINGTLYRGETDVEYVRGKILQTLSIVRGELSYDSSFGVPYSIFSSINNFSEDVAIVESLLISNITEANFNLGFAYLGQGLFNILVTWEYQGSEYKETFNVDVLDNN